jgi:pyruvate dehydrogenase E2 component (dihydrolipoamide acetyltransferase)
MPFWYFFTIPQLPPDVLHLPDQIQLRQYLCAEGDSVEPGTPIAIIENHCAVMRLKANGNGILQKMLFRPNTYVNVGDPIATIGADGEAIPYGQPKSILEIIERKHR